MKFFKWYFGQQSMVTEHLYLLQAFSVLFFFMLFVLGIGSNIAMCTCIITILRDKFPALKAWQASIGLATVGFSFGLIYVTPVSLNDFTTHVSERMFTPLFVYKCRVAKQCWTWLTRSVHHLLYLFLQLVKLLLFAGFMVKSIVFQTFYVH